MKPNKIYRRVDNVWTIVGYRCRYCLRDIRSEIVCEKHMLTCKNINKSNKETEMPVQAVMKNGERYYRWGSEGKLYKDRSDAEAQGRAAYASGYRSKDDNSSQKKKGSDGKVCWEGYRYGGSNPDGSDKCIKVKR